MTSWERLRERTLSVAAVREVDRIAMEEFHMNSLVLMENAALSCVDWLTQRFSQNTRALFLCGRGNNGGDGLAIVRHLRLYGWQCRVLVSGPVHALSPDARVNWQILTARGHRDCCVVGDPATAGAGVTPAVDIAQLLVDADVIVDAMLGSGASGVPRAPFDKWIQMANAAPGVRVAIDIPAGVDAETGMVAPIAFRAAATLTFIARKPGFRQPAAQANLGEVSVMSIGIPNELVDELLPQSLSSAPGGGS
jgi:NAD(P)H-hydrate epimerase